MSKQKKNKDSVVIPKDVDELIEIMDKAMKAVHKKLRQDKIDAGHPLVVGDGKGGVKFLDPKTMEEISEEEAKRMAKENSKPYPSYPYW